MIVQLVVLLTWRVANLVLFLSRRIPSLHALDELDVLGKLVEKLVELEEELEELDDARELEISVLEFLCDMLLLVIDLVGLGWLRLDLNHEGHIAPQVLELHVVVGLVVVPRHLVHLDVVALAPLVLVVVGVAVLVLVRKQLGFDDVDALESRCRVEDCG